jgi:hypothetical protein
MLKFSSLVVKLMLLAVILTACTQQLAATPVVSGPATVSDPTRAPATGAPAAPATAQPSQPAVNPTEPGQPATPAQPAAGSASFVLFDKGEGAGAFRSYAMDGSLRYEAPAPDVEYPDIYTISVVKDAVYFSPYNQEERSIIRTSADGGKTLSLTVAKLSAFRVSPDEKWIAWSTFVGDAQPPSSQLFVGKLDGNGGVFDVQQIASYNQSQSAAFWLVPVQWTGDSTRLLFQRSLSGLGGYIPFGGEFSMYGYEPASGQITTYVTPEDKNGMCIDSIRLDLDKVVFNCHQGSQEITVRDLKDGKEVTIPALPEQGVAGGAEFSPSGQWLAYATARNNPDDEAGQVAVISGDLSGAPQVIYKVDQKRYPIVQGWLDDSTLLVTVTNFTTPGSTVMTIKNDGTGATELGSGVFVGWVK